MPVRRPPAAAANDKKEEGRSSTPVALCGVGDIDESGQLLVGDVADELGSGPTLDLVDPKSLGLWLALAVFENDLPAALSSCAAARRIS